MLPTTFGLFSAKEKNKIFAMHDSSDSSFIEFHADVRVCFQPLNDQKEAIPINGYKYAVSEAPWI